MSAPSPAMRPHEPRRVFIKTYGCQMNVYDSERLAAALVQAGYRMWGKPAGADVIILNTCHIREKAAEKLYSELGRLAALKKTQPQTVIGVAGCVAQAEGEEILRRAPHVELVLGPQALARLGQILGARKAGKAEIFLDLEAEQKFTWLDRLAAHPPATTAPSSPSSPSLPSSPVPSPSALLTIQEGCDKFCTFCVVPYTRGREVSRPAARILAEAQACLARGAREITLLGQNVNAWSHGGAAFSDLLAQLAQLDGLSRLRFTTSHPRDMTGALAQAFGSLDVLMPHLHLPVQSGSDKILRAMNRRHSVARYEREVARLRAARPDIALSSDFIVGFPGESDEDFAATLALVRRVRFARGFAFMYSPRFGTPAAELPQIAGEEKRARLHALQKVLSEQEQDFNAAQVGRTMAVLVENVRDGIAYARSPYNHIVALAAPSAHGGEERWVRITAAGGRTLRGELAEDDLAGKQLARPPRFAHNVVAATAD